MRAESRSQEVVVESGDKQGAILEDRPKVTHVPLLTQGGLHNFLTSLCSAVRHG